MSKYEDYEESCKHYDSYRKAQNVDFIASIIATYLKKPLSEIHLLEAGCGTGNFSKALLDQGLGKISMLDGSLGMLEVSRRKVASYQEQGKVAALVHHLLPSLPFEDEEFDAVIVVQVLHHLDAVGSGYPRIQEFFRSASRVLKPGGVIFINYCSLEQCIDFSWYCPLIPKAAIAMGERIPPRDEFFQALNDAGFGDVSEFITFDHKFFSAAALRPENGIQDPEWRKLDSIWKLAEETNELEEAFKKYDEIVANGTLESLTEEYVAKNKMVGQTTNLFARKME